MIERREREKFRLEIQENEDQHFQYVDGMIYTDGKKDATLAIFKNNDKWYRDISREEHYIIIIEEPGEFYLSHTTPNSRKEIDISASIHEEIKDIPLEDDLRIIKSDGTPIMTGEYNGAIRKLEELLGRPLQWCICLLHCIELPLRHVFLLVDGTSTASDSFSGPIGKKLCGKVSD